MQPTPSDPYQQYTYGYAPAVSDRLLAYSKLVVDQKAKLIELRNEYSIYDESGNRIGSVMQVGQSVLTRLLRLVLRGDSLLGVKLEIREANGAVALLLHKPAFRITCAVSRPNGTVIGRIAAKIRLGKARMAITDPAERVLGEVRAENLRAWNFNVQDATGRLIARVDKKWAGARELFTTADKYRVELDPNLPDPLRSLVGVPPRAAEAARDSLGGAVATAARLSEQTGAALLRGVRPGSQPQGEPDPRQHTSSPPPEGGDDGTAARVAALRANLHVAIAIATESFPPLVLSVRGRATVDEVDGVAPEYALSARRYLGAEAAASYLAQIDQPGTRMARIAVRPTWVGLIDFQTRLPSGMGGVTG